MANRGPAFDSIVFSIHDLEEQGSNKLPTSYRGKTQQWTGAVWNSGYGLELN